MRCAAKAAADSAAMRLRSSAAEEVRTLNAAGDNLSAASSSQPASDTAVGSRGDAPRDIEDYELKLIYSGESDGDTDSKKPATNKVPDSAKPASTKSDSRSAMSLAERRDIFGSSDELDDPSPRRSRSLESDRGRGSGQCNDDNGDAVMCHDQDDRIGHGVGTSIGITQEARDRGILRVAPEREA
uniref:RxLR effector candidate protein n=1 Tax=Hyaloperonospora arabidopsidis (strain Emoy2) TaxID=559515 RepID=M4BZI3_HYAAE